MRNCLSVVASLKKSETQSFVNVAGLIQKLTVG